MDVKTMARVAELARLSIPEQELEMYAVQMSKALEYFQAIAQVKTEGIEPLVTPTQIEDFWREDVLKQDLNIEAVIKNAPQVVGNLFKVPPVV